MNNDNKMSLMNWLTGSLQQQSGDEWAFTIDPDHEAYATLFRLKDMLSINVRVGYDTDVYAEVTPRWLLGMRPQDWRDAERDGVGLETKFKKSRPMPNVARQLLTYFVPVAERVHVALNTRYFDDVKAAVLQDGTVKHLANEFGVTPHGNGFYKDNLVVEVDTKGEVSLRVHTLNSVHATRVIREILGQ